MNAEDAKETQRTQKGIQAEGNKQNAAGDLRQSAASGQTSTTKREEGFLTR